MTFFENDEVKTEALKLAKGSYQKGLLTGENRWSGSDLAGKAKKYSSSYYHSRLALSARLKKAGFRLWTGSVPSQGRAHITLVWKED
jgi:hypothetical protein